MTMFWVVVMASTLVSIYLLLVLSIGLNIKRIADAANDIANYLCDFDYGDDDDPDKEPVLDADSVNAESDIHLEGLKPLGKVLPFRKTG